MNQSFFLPERLLLLYIPWLISLFLKQDPVLSYFVAWAGSFVIFYLTMAGWIRPLPHDLSISEQLMRPIFLVQIIFAGYMASTSIFYFMDVMGYVDFEPVSHLVVDQERLQLTAECQRYYCLGHAAFVSGIILFMNYKALPRYYVKKDSLANLLMIFAMVSFPVSVLFLKIPGLSQFYFQLNSLSFIAGTMALAFAIPLRKIRNTILCLSFYSLNFYQALISGFKEPIIISVLVLGIFLYPNYKKLVATVFIPLLLLLFIFLPTYNRIFRENAWSGETNAEDASKLAFDVALNTDSSVEDDSNWSFLAFRLSEIDMFTKFVESTPRQVDYYGLKLLKQSAIAIVPRIFWPSKPNLEELIMERVYDANVVNRAANVSAKPAFIADAYLSFGGIGVFLSLFIYGALAQVISLKAENLFGGYTLGTAFIFSGLFQIFWRGLSFEFLINTVAWSYITMLVIHKILVTSRVLKET